MLVLGLVLVLIAAGAVVAMAFNGSDTSVSLFDGHVHGTALSVYLAGVATVLLLVLGLALMRLGARRARTNRQNNKRLRRLERNEAARRNQGPLAGAATRGDDATVRRERSPVDGSADPGTTSATDPARASADPGDTPTGGPGSTATGPTSNSTGGPGSGATGPGSAGGR